MKPAPGRAPEYTLLKAYDKLPAGSFVNPIEFQYLPRDRQEEFKFYNPQIEHICFTSLGFLRIPKNLIEVKT